MSYKIIILLLLTSISNANVTYTKDIKPIFKKRCDNCHKVMGPDRDWMKYDSVLKSKDKIKLRLEINSMPPGNATKMTDSERKMVIDWINNGCKK